MGVPALFRWLSKKYPRIVVPVVEEDAAKVPSADGQEVEIPINISGPNPNGTEFDNLYLDMNGIVHPCTHPEGKPAPETEEAMMIEIFNYTERVVNMVRPRKVLFMAIDGVAPRAKMNQQRSRRFRAAQEAYDKEEARQEGIAIFEAMGKNVTELKQNAKPPWDSNAITPGTPFMELLAASLRYWVVSKLNTDPGWKELKVIISDAGVPGEGEHKIMDFIRRQRVHPHHDPNTQHCIYGLDADLIMLSLATHEPFFKVLREDVFADDKKNACRTCGQEGHYAAQCKGLPKIRQDEHDIQKKPAEKKPFIFLDVSILREYLEIELNTHQTTFPFDFERAIDDWVLLIFFVGNDFLPHLPSLEIREGAVDKLLKIWKIELPRMGGYITRHGELDLARAQLILQGIASQEREIFQNRREAENRQNQNAKRRKLDQQMRNSPNSSNITSQAATPSSQSQFQSRTSTPDIKPVIHGLPPRPSFDTFGTATPAVASSPPKQSTPATSSPAAAAAPSSPANFATEGAKALAGSNHDVVANRRAIRMANMSAAEAFKAELAALTPLKPKNPKVQQPQESSVVAPPVPVTRPDTDEDIPGFDASPEEDGGNVARDAQQDADSGNALDAMKVEEDQNFGANGLADPPANDAALSGVKRKVEEVDKMEDTDTAIVTVQEEDDEPDKVEETVIKKLKVNADGSVDQEDTVRLWEPGYAQRYYQQKFGIPYDDEEEKKKIILAYVEGLAWVLQYYYQGTPSWKWFYPYHYAPFAADFTDIDKLQVRFESGQPFKPFEQLMGVFPAASGKHIPKPLRNLMTAEDSPILDFYPSSFEIDMNGKKMSWQGVALLPFIDEARLLSAMIPLYDQLTEEEKARNSWGSNALFVARESPLHPFLEGIYIKRKNQEPVALDPKLSAGMSGSVLPDPGCIPGATFYCPLAPEKIPDVNPPLGDIYDDGSISCLYYFPRQIQPHRSILLNGTRRPQRVLQAEDRDHVLRGGNRERRGGPSYGNHSMHMETGRSGIYNDYSHQGYSNGYQGGGGGGGGGGGYYDRPPPRDYNGRGGYGGGGYGGGYGGGGYGGGGYGGRPNHQGGGYSNYNDGRGGGHDYNRPYGRGGRGY